MQRRQEKTQQPGVHITALATATTIMPTNTEPTRLRPFHATRKVGMAAQTNRLSRPRTTRLSWTTSEGNSMAANTATGTKRSQATTGSGSDRDERNHTGSTRGT